MEDSGESEAELLGETPHGFSMPGAENIADRLKDQVGLHQRLLRDSSREMDRPSGQRSLITVRMFA